MRPGWNSLSRGAGTGYGMRMNPRFLPGLVLALALAFASPAAEMKSPDGNVVVHFEVKDLGGAKNCAVYRVDFKGRPLVVDSRLGLELEGGPLGEGLKLESSRERRQDTKWKPVWGERAEVIDRFHETTFDLREAKEGGRALQITFRLYNEGAAFCYTLPKGPADRVKITRENSEFRFGADHQTWAVYSAQGKYTGTTISGVKSGCERPMPVKLADDVYAALGEAKCVEFSRMKLAPLQGVANALVSDLSGPVDLPLPMTSPWRVVQVANSPGRLLEGNDLFLNLNDPCEIVDTSWIKPGKVIREVTLTTAGGKAAVDFAAQRGLQYIEFDAGWYGHEYDPKSDASAVNLDPKRSKGPLDLQEVIRYAGEHGIGVLLYVNRLAAEKQLDEILPLYRSWGIKGVKYGFVNVGPQKWTSWLHMAVRKAALHKLMVDVHDEYRPTGYARTYPNLMTQEGIGGDEETPEPRQTLTLAFSRLLAGPADNTVCYFDGRVNRMSSHAFQLAKPVCLFSAWQFLYWYDRPASAGKPEDAPELEFWKHMPATWDETKVLHGSIGEYAVIARRKGGAWFIGCLNDDTARTLDLPLAFLAPGGKFTARIYSDDPATPTRTHVKIETRSVDASTVLQAALPARGGQAVWIAP